MNAAYLAVGVLALVVQAYSQCIPTCATTAPICAPTCACPAPALIAAPAPMLAAPAPIISPTVIAPNSVAASLADTLSLLTVSSLLAETLPFGSPLVVPANYPGCGCGYPQPYGYVL